MKNIIGISLDPKWPIAYLRYSKSKPSGSYDLIRDLDGVVRTCGYADPDDQYRGVMVDLNDTHEICGVEILDIDDPGEFGLARDFAALNDLEFPADIRAAARHRAA